MTHNDFGMKPLFGRDECYIKIWNRTFTHNYRSRRKDKMTTTAIDFNAFPDTCCPICQEDFDQEDITKKPVIIPCGHALHMVCTAFLFVPVGASLPSLEQENGRCPLCRKKLFHMSYKFYTQEMVAEREENLRQELQAYQEAFQRIPMTPDTREATPDLQTPEISRETTPASIADERITVYRRNPRLTQSRRRLPRNNDNAPSMNQETENDLVQEIIETL